MSGELTNEIQSRKAESLAALGNYVERLQELGYRYDRVNSARDKEKTYNMQISYWVSAFINFMINLIVCWLVNEEIVLTSYIYYPLGISIAFCAIYFLIIFNTTNSHLAALLFAVGISVSSILACFCFKFEDNSPGWLFLSIALLLLLCFRLKLNKDKKVLKKLEGYMLEPLRNT